MESLPSDLHQYLAQFVDESTRLLLPLTCKSLYVNLGFRSFTLQEAVAAVAKDDNLRLLLHFLRDKKSPRYKSFYPDCIFRFLLQSDSLSVADWYCKKRYVMPKREYWFYSGMNISLRVCDRLLAHTKSDYDTALLERVIEYDRVDIFRERYCCGHQGVLPSIEHLYSMLQKGALRCFQYFQARFNNVPGLLARLFAEGADVIVDQYLPTQKFSGQLNEEMMKSLLLNPNYQSSFFLDLYGSEYQLTFQESLQVMRTKHPQLAIRLLESVAITEDHCRTALDVGRGLLVDYVFSRFEGKLHVSHVYVHEPFNLRLVVSKVTDLNCFLGYILRENDVDLFRQLLDEGRAINLERLFSYSAICPELIKVFFTYRTLNAEEQMRIYSFHGDCFLTLMRDNGQVIDAKVLNKERRKVADREKRAAKRTKKAHGAPFVSEG